MSLKKTLFWMAVAVAFWGGVSALYAADGCVRRLRRGRVQSDGRQLGADVRAGCCTQTVLVPEWTTETRKFMATECAPETRERKVTVFRCVAETTNVQRHVTDMVPETRTRTETFTVQVPITRQVTQQYQVCVPTFRDVQHSYTVAMPVWGQQEEKYTVMVPHTETRQATRQVVDCIPVSETRTGMRRSGPLGAAVPADLLHSGGSGSSCGSSCGKLRFELWIELWIELRFELRRFLLRRGCGCGGCGGCGSSCCMTWVPNIVQEPIQVTVMKTQISEVPYQYNVTVCTPETRSRMIPVCHFDEPDANLHRAGLRLPQRNAVADLRRLRLQDRAAEPRGQFTVCVPHQRTFTEQVVNYRNVPEEKTEQYTVMVPHQVEKSMCVQVCHMVPHEATVQTSCYSSGCGCGR